MLSKKNTLKILDKGDLQAIHAASLEVLSKVGVMIDSPSTLDLLEKNGYGVDRHTKIVKMPESRVSEAVKSCKRNFRWVARSKRHSFDIRDGRTKFGPGSQCFHYIDPETGQARSTTLRDGIEMCRLLDAIDTSSLGFIPLYPHDVPEGAMSIVMWAAGLLNSGKPTYGSWGNENEFQLMLRIADIFLGDGELLRKNYMFPGYIDPISPLAHDDGMMETLVRYGRWGMPVFVMVMALAGGTAPASLAGLLAQQNAEILSCAAISKCVTSSPRIVYGSVSCPLDMRSGISATGSPEFSLLGVGSVQMAKFYGLPSDMGVQSDSKTVDAQTTYEKTQAAMMAVLSGADMAELFLGSTEAFLTTSPLQLMIDDEIASNVQRIARGIEVNEASLSVDVISRIGPMGNFLKHPKTLEQFRREHSLSRLSDRSTRSQWEATGSKDTLERARTRVKELLETHIPDPLEPEQRRDLDALIKEYSVGFDVDALERF